ncbi:histone-lysine N-methyltransferase PRDM9-like isoform X2 [Stegodyphus dumicola]|uniref:histone-lysine N-methyltransferase PRDM9-like isoform X2 n=1 Tax=Stegodyphus dumicola TaxID=202533 RepID=UPI0015A90E4D|nr:histone-lysine N-methyltransferase PRDM9-like isoform X2 [Stegodyphus dumicola]
MDYEESIQKKIQEFFSAKEWQTLSNYEKTRYTNQCRNYEVLLSTEKIPQVPKIKPFAVPNESARKKKSASQDKISMKNKTSNREIVLPQQAKTSFSDLKNMDYKSIADILLSPAEVYFRKLENILMIENDSDPEVELIESAPVKRYPKRNIPRKIYTEEDISSDDDYLYCEDCNLEHKGACPTHGPMLLVCDQKVAKGLQNKALGSTPCFLSIGKSSLPKAGLGVWTEIPLPKGMVFGPYKGTIVRKREEASKSGYAWQVWKGGKAHHYIEGFDKSSSSWLRFVNCADIEERQSLTAFQYKKMIYYKTYKYVLPYTELLVWYGDQFARDLGIDTKKGVLDDVAEEVDGFECDVCQALFSEEEAMLRHRKSHPHMIADRRHKCHFCTYSSIKSTDLRRHLLTHLGERPHQCKHCEKSFTQASDMRRHMRTHTGEKPFVCDVCSQAFALRSCLNRHRNIHSDKRPYRCSECGKDFPYLSGVWNHQRTHTGQKPYRCTQCEYRCAQGSNLRKHVIRHHTRDFLHTCSYCGKGFLNPSQVKQHNEQKHFGPSSSRLSVDGTDSFSPDFTCVSRREGDNLQLERCHPAGYSMTLSTSVVVK